MSGSLKRSGGENVPGIIGTWASGNFSYLVRGPWLIPNYVLSFVFKKKQVIRNSTDVYFKQFIWLYIWEHIHFKLVLSHVTFITFLHLWSCRSMMITEIPRVDDLFHVLCILIVYLLYTFFTLDIDVFNWRNRLHLITYFSTRLLVVMCGNTTPIML